MKSSLLIIWFSITKIQIWCMSHTVVVCFLLLMREIPVFVSVCGEEKAVTPGQLGDAVLSVVCCDCHVCLLILYKIFLLPLRIEFYMCVVVLHAGEGIFALSTSHMYIWKFMLHISLSLHKECPTECMCMSFPIYLSVNEYYWWIWFVADDKQNYEYSYAQ